MIYICVCVISLCVFGLWPMLCYTWSSLFRPRRDGLCLEWSAWVACDFPCLWLVWCIKTGKRLAHCSGFHWSGGIIRCLVGQHYLKWLFLAAANYRWYWDRCFFLVPVVLVDLRTALLQAQPFAPLPSWSARLAAHCPPDAQRDGRRFGDMPKEKQPQKDCLILPIGSMYAIYGNIYHQYTPNVSIYTIHGSYGL